MIVEATFWRGLVIVIVSLVLIIACIWRGVTLTLRQSKNQELTPNQKDKLRKERKCERSTRFNRNEILNTLVQLRGYITDGISKQQITEEDFRSIKEQFTVQTFNVAIGIRMFILLTLWKRFPKLFLRASYPIILEVTIKLDSILQPYKLGTLPITEQEPYKTSRKRLAEMGLSPRLNLMINNHISLSELSGIALLIPQFFQIGHPTKFAMRRVSHFLPHLPKKIDDIMSNLLSTISEELERFMLGE